MRPGGSSIISPATDAGLGVETHTIVPGPEGSLACPEFRLSMQHGMPDPPMELMASEDGLVVARCYRELLLFSPEEAEPMARMPVPDEFRALTLTGDGARLIARVGQQTVAVCLDPKQWSEEALRRAGRELTEEERQRLLREFDSLGRPAVAQSSVTSA